MKIKNDINADYIKSVLQYNMDTGTFTWRHRPDKPKDINTRFAGKTAGCISKAGYRVIRINNRLYLAQRLAWLIMMGEWPDQEVDHKDGVKSNNIWSNLRIATHAQNKFNCGLSKRNTSGLKGVSWHSQTKKWIAQIVISGKHYHLGLYNNPEDAHRAYVEAAKTEHGEFLRTG